MRTYGMPYKGGKSAIADKIIAVLPEADCLVDLFGGGGAITHCAALSGKYKRVIYNEIDPVAYKGFKMAINGEFAGENRWISREDFNNLKDTDPYAAICFSFGNGLKGYAYSLEKERLKKHLHNMFFSRTPKAARLHWKAFVREFSKVNNEKMHKINPALNAPKSVTNEQLRFLEKGELQSLERLERLQSLERLERLPIECFNLSYEQVEIPENSVIYCDIPYNGTNKYKSELDYDRFYKWALNQNAPVYISEYQMPKEFEAIFSIEKTISFGACGSKKMIERLFVPKREKCGEDHGQSA